MARVSGRVDRKDLALIFLRAAEVAGQEQDLALSDPDGKVQQGGRLGKRLLDELMTRAREVRRDVGAPPPARRPPAAASAEASVPRAEPQPGGPTPPASAGDLDLVDLSRSIEDLLSGALAPDDPPRDGPEVKTPPDVLGWSHVEDDETDPCGRRRGLGLQTLEELFVRGGEVRFEGYLEELEGLLEELYERFKTVSGEFGITSAEIARGEILRSAADALEARRAERKARARLSDRLPAAVPMPPVPASEAPTRVSGPPRSPASEAPTQPFVQREASEAAVDLVGPGVYRVRCGCDVARTIDTRTVRPWRIRCKTCGQVLFDPGATLVLGADAPPAQDPTFRQRVSDSSELQPLRDEDGPRACRLHTGQPAVATCRRCARELCAACLDEVGEAFVCSGCSSQEEARGPAAAARPTGPFQRPEVSAKEVVRAFERALLMAGMEARLDRRGGAGGSKVIRLIYDYQRRILKAPLVPRVAAGDRIQLNDGRVLEVTGRRLYEVAGEACYQELAWAQLGRLKGPLRTSWEGFPEGG